MSHPRSYVMVDGQSAEEFVRQFSIGQHRILRFIHTLVPHLADAEEILQETSVILWKKWPEFDRDRDFIKWACGIARLEVFRMFRDKNRHMLHLSEAVLNEIADIAASEAYEIAQYDAGATALRQCLRELPESEREILLLKYQHEQTVQQIARTCQRPKSSVHDLIAKTRMRLLRCVRKRLAV